MIDRFPRRIAGRATRATMRTEELPVESLEHAQFAAEDQTDTGLVHHGDRAGQYVSIRYTEHLAEAGITASVVSRGDIYGNALTEAVNCLYTTRPIHARSAWTSGTEFEFSTVNWAQGSHNQWHHQDPGYLTPIEVEVEAAYAENREVPPAPA